MCAERTPLTSAVSLSEVQTADSGSFAYANPGTIHWGPGSVAEHLEQQLDEAQAQRVFVISTRSVSSNSALGGRLEKLLGERCVGQFAEIFDISLRDHQIMNARLRVGMFNHYCLVRFFDYVRDKRRKSLNTDGC